MIMCVTVHVRAVCVWFVMLQLALMLICLLETAYADEDIESEPRASVLRGRSEDNTLIYVKCTEHNPLKQS